MQPKKLTVGDIADRTGASARNLARKIRYNLDNQKFADRWAAAGIPDPAVVRCGKNDPFITAFADVIPSIIVPDSAVATGGAYYDAADRDGVTADPVVDKPVTAAADSDTVVINKRSTPMFKPGGVLASPRPVPEPRRQRRRGRIEQQLFEERADLNRKIKALPVGGEAYNKIAVEIQRLDRSIKSEHAKRKAEPVRPLSDRMSPDLAFWLILFVVLIADGISAGLIYYVGLSDYPNPIHYAGAIGFSVVGIAVGYSAVLNYLSIDDRDTANLYAFAFAGWQIALHTAAVFGYIQFGQVVVYAGIALATVATIAAIKTR